MYETTIDADGQTIHYLDDTDIGSWTMSITYCGVGTNCEDTVNFQMLIINNPCHEMSIEPIKEPFNSGQFKAATRFHHTIEQFAALMYYDVQYGAYYEQFVNEGGDCSQLMTMQLEGTSMQNWEGTERRWNIEEIDFIHTYDL